VYKNVSVFKKNVYSIQYCGNV